MTGWKMMSRKVCLVSSNVHNLRQSVNLLKFKVIQSLENTTTMLCNDYCDTDARVAFLYLYFCEHKNEKGKKKKMSVESPLVLQPRVEDSWANTRGILNSPS